MDGNRSLPSQPDRELSTTLQLFTIAFTARCSKTWCMEGNQSLQYNTLACNAAVILDAKGQHVPTFLEISVGVAKSCSSDTNGTSGLSRTSATPTQLVFDFFFFLLGLVFLPFLIFFLFFIFLSNLHPAPSSVDSASSQCASTVAPSLPSLSSLSEST